MKKYIVTLISMVLIISSTLVGVSPISAEGSSDYLDHVENQLKDSEHIIDKNTIQDYTSRSVEEIGKDIHFKEEDLNIGQATVVKYVDPETEEIAFINNIPISKEGSHELSNIAIIYDEKDNLIQYTELYLTKNEHGNFNVKSYVDGEETVNEDTDEKFMTAEEYAEHIKDNPELFVDVSLLAKCLSISIGLAQVISIGCAAACFFTAGLGCVACVAALAGFAVGGNTGCVIAAFS